MEDGTSCWKKKILDFLCDDETEGKNDSLFTILSLRMLWELGELNNLEHIYFFSDNAGNLPKNNSSFLFILIHFVNSFKVNHFRNQYVIREMHELEVKKAAEIDWLMYAPLHGNSLCDAHGGNLSSIRNSMSKFPRSSREFAQTIISKTNAQVHFLQKKDRSKQLKGVKLNGVTQFHHFNFKGGTMREEFKWKSNKWRDISFN